MKRDVLIIFNCWIRIHTIKFKQLFLYYLALFTNDEVKLFPNMICAELFAANIKVSIKDDVNAKKYILFN